MASLFYTDICELEVAVRMIIDRFRNLYASCVWKAKKRILVYGELVSLWSSAT